MHDPAPNDDIAVPETLSGGDRDARVEQLLLAGLDHYFAGQYERSVHVWTRVLFLDRGHARARAYIERARAALAERHRHSDELLHHGTAAFERGHVGAARRYLTAAVEQGAAAEVALSYLARLDRLDAPPEPRPSGVATSPQHADSLPPVTPRRWSRSVVATAMTLAGIAALAWFGPALADHAPWRAGAGAVDVAPIRQAEALPTVRPSEVAITRARTLFETGHASDAIRLLAAIPLADPHRADADRLLAEIQRALLSAVEPTESSR